MLMMKDKDDVLYTGRLYLFNVIPLWKVTKTKQEWKQIAVMMSSRNKIVMFKFEDDDHKNVY
jgi:hypothetical protein